MQPPCINEMHNDLTATHHPSPNGGGGGVSAGHAALSRAAPRLSLRACMQGTVYSFMKGVGIHACWAGLPRAVWYKGGV